jgi:hypothetical protein
MRELAATDPHRVDCCVLCLNPSEPQRTTLNYTSAAMQARRCRTRAQEIGD